ncbi:restriction endonuclease subunit S [Micromonospora carbonacea]|nr:restriction endonuclease subunit S [Micromonospora carbonacea]
MTDLPPGWVHTTLGEIADTALGKMLDRAKGSGEHLKPYLRNINVQWGRIDESDVLAMDVPPDQEERYGVKAGDLLVCEGGEIGRCAIWRGGSGYMAYQKALHRVRPYGGIVPEYLRYYLEHLSGRGVLARYATGSTIKHFPQEQLRQLPVLLPPAAEQRCIVGALEEQIARCDVAFEQVRRANVRSVQLRDAWREELSKAVRVGSHVQLGDVLAEPLRNGHSAPAADNGLVRTLTLTAVTRSEFIDGFTKMTAADPGRVRGLWLRSGDILIQRSNTPDLVGTAALYEGPNDWAIFPDLVIRVRVNDEVLPDFVALMLQAPSARRYFRSRAKGLAGSMPKIDQQAIRQFEFMLPSKRRQTEIVNRFSELSTIVNRVADVVRNSAVKAKRLRASLLAEAFAGQLVPQDPDDEPASELLARIRAERAATIPKQRTRSRRTTKELPAPATRVTGDDYQQETLPL